MAWLWEGEGEHPTRSPIHRKEVPKCVSITIAMPI